MGAQKNTIVRSVSPKSIFEDMTALVPATLTCDQGDILIYDAATQTVIKPTIEADAITMLGLAQQTLVLGKPKSPYSGTAVDAAQAAPRQVGPVYGVIARMVAKTGDAFTPGLPVFFNPATGARGVAIAGTKSIGIYQGPAVVAVAGQEIEVLIGSRYPADTLQF